MLWLATWADGGGACCAPGVALDTWSIGAVIYELYTGARLQAGLHDCPVLQKDASMHAEYCEWSSGVQKSRIDTPSHEFQSCPTQHALLFLLCIRRKRWFCRRCQHWSTALLRICW